MTIQNVERPSEREMPWDEIVSEYRARIERFVRSRGISDPDDIVQDVLTAAASRGGSYDRAGLESWLFTVAYRRVADVYRRRYRRPSIPLDGIDAPNGGLDPAVSVCRSETAEEVADALARLSDRERAVVKMRVYEGTDAAVVGRMLGMSPSHVRVVQTRALAKMRRALSPALHDELRTVIGGGFLAALSRRFTSAAGRVSGWVGGQMSDSLQTVTSLGAAAATAVVVATAFPAASAPAGLPTSTTATPAGVTTVEERPSSSETWRRVDSAGTPHTSSTAPAPEEPAAPGGSVAGDGSPVARSVPDGSASAPDAAAPGDASVEIDLGPDDVGGAVSAGALGAGVDIEGPAEASADVALGLEGVSIEVAAEVSGASAAVVVETGDELQVGVTAEVAGGEVELDASTATDLVGDLLDAAGETGGGLLGGLFGGPR
jgi:RNA polymerase sigma-70 factor (ECF subfamily)